MSDTKRPRLTRIKKQKISYEVWSGLRDKGADRQTDRQTDINGYAHRDTAQFASLYRA